MANDNQVDQVDQDEQDDQDDQNEQDEQDEQYNDHDGDQGDESGPSMEEYVLEMVDAGLYALGNGDSETALRTLSAAESVTSIKKWRRRTDEPAVIRKAVRAQALLALARYYAERAQCHAALEYANKAYKIELGLDECYAPERTHLLLASLLARTRNPAAAIRHYQMALVAMGPEPHPELAAMAHHNIGLELERMGNIPAALKAHANAVDAATSALGADHPTTAAVVAEEAAAKARAAAARRRRDKSSAVPRVAHGHPLAPIDSATAEVSPYAGEGGSPDERPRTGRIDVEPPLIPLLGVEADDAVGGGTSDETSSPQRRQTRPRPPAGHGASGCPADEQPILQAGQTDTASGPEPKRLIGQLRVHIVSANILSAAAARASVETDASGKVLANSFSPYCVAFVGSAEERTPVARDTLTPQFGGDDMVFELSGGATALDLALFDAQDDAKDPCLGAGSIALWELHLDGRRNNVVVDLDADAGQIRAWTELVLAPEAFADEEEVSAAEADAAATRIQATWRGHAARSRLRAARAAAARASWRGPVLVNVIEARDLPTKTPVLCTATAGKVTFATERRGPPTAPVWNEAFVFGLAGTEAALDVSLYEANKVKGKPLARGRLELSGLETRGVRNDVWLAMAGRKKNSAAGEVRVAIIHRPSREQVPAGAHVRTSERVAESETGEEVVWEGKMLVRVIEARYTNGRVGACKVDVQGQAETTRLVTKTTTPEWNDAFIFDLDGTDGVINVRLLDLKGKKSLAVGHIPVSMLLDNGASNDLWFEFDGYDGQVRLDIVHNPTQAQIDEALLAGMWSGRILVRVLRASKVATNVACAVELNGDRQRTRLTEEAEWDEGFIFELEPTREPTVDFRVVKVDDGVIASGVLELTELKRDGVVNRCNVKLTGGRKGAALDAIVVHDPSEEELRGVTARQEELAAQAAAEVAVREAAARAAAEAAARAEAEAAARRAAAQAAWTGPVLVRVLSARNVPQGDTFSKSDAYCVVRVQGEKAQTRVVGNAADPVWNEAFEFELDGTDSTLAVALYDEDADGDGDDALALGHIDLKKLDKDGAENDEWYAIGDDGGEVHLVIVHHPTEETLAAARKASEPLLRSSPSTAAWTGPITVRVVEAKNVPKGDAFSQSDARCVLELQGEERRTSVVADTDAPTWNEEFGFELDGSDDTLAVKLVDDDNGSDDVLAVGHVPLRLLERDGVVNDQWYGFDDSDAMVRLVVVHGAEAAGESAMEAEPEAEPETEAAPQSQPWTGPMLVRVVEATKVPKGDTFSKSDARCVLELQGEERRTSVVDDTDAPTWNEEFDFELDGSDETLAVKLVDDDDGSDDVLAVGHVPLNMLERDGETDQWYGFDNCDAMVRLVVLHGAAAEARLAAEAATKAKAEEEARLAAEEEARLAAEAAAKAKAEEEARLAAEAAAKAKAEEEARLAAEAAAKAKAEEEARLAAEAAAKAKAEEEARLAAEAAAKAKAEEEARLAAEEEARLAAEAAAKAKAEEEARLAAEEEARLAAEAAAKAKAEEEARLAAEEEARLAAEEEARLAAEEEARLAAEAAAAPEPWTGLTRIQVVEAKKVPKGDAFSKSDARCVIAIQDQERRTNVVDNTEAPTWNETFDFVLDGSDATLEVKLVDDDDGSDDVLAVGHVPLGMLERDGVVNDQWFGFDNCEAIVHLIITHRPAAEPALAAPAAPVAASSSAEWAGDAMVLVASGSELPVDSYVRLEMGETSVRTSPVTGAAAEINEAFLIPSDGADTSLAVFVCDNKTDEVISAGQVPLESLKADSEENELQAGFSDSSTAVKLLVIANPTEEQMAMYMHSANWTPWTGPVELRIVEALHVENSEGDDAAFCELAIQGQTFLAGPAVVGDDRHPVWDKSFVLELDGSTSKLKLRLLDSTKNALTHGRISLKYLNRGGAVNDSWLGFDKKDTRIHIIITHYPSLEYESEYGGDEAAASASASASASAAVSPTKTVESRVY
ncbi:C2 domain-containing protein [Thecamonas trahens ATCC 50062]|uniref:C2 domain-containing protein n=1 Tax=Thecamonas trahens ATCC 50062 TaxID=461836 RepID=A0A0L0DUT7_THETB|nr:C2 domain-containing protein [Thecamonas trahens ATCC 50062]KNC55273.1 C2 domain-containing protein [Thecamonas trahens ATCC 50062]|eukprot:XP_013753096.1 C2 domain-containing protein [Thecamonas trahens ATCC 50062]